MCILYYSRALIFDINYDHLNLMEYNYGTFYT